MELELELELELKLGVTELVNQVVAVVVQLVLLSRLHSTSFICLCMYLGTLTYQTWRQLFSYARTRG